MKKTLVHIAIFLLLTAGMTACKKSGESGVFAARINGSPWSSTKFFATLSRYLPPPGMTTNQRALRIKGENGTENYIVLQMDNYSSSISSYPISFINRAYYRIKSEYHTASSGTITITYKSANNVEGTFSFTADSLTITDGRFNVHLTEW